MWKKTDKWRPARTGTASGGSGVQNSETSEIGLAKTQFAHREKLASDLAARVGVTVPKVLLDRIDGAAGLHAISMAHGKESIDVSLLRDRLADRFSGPEVQNALKEASGLLAFHAWLATQDLKDEHLVIAPDEDGDYTVAAIDFAYSLDLPAPDGGPVLPPAGPASLIANVDKNIVAATVEKIESVSDEEIRCLVSSLPNELVGDDEKERLNRGLIGRRGKIKAVMLSQGWMP